MARFYAYAMYTAEDGTRINLRFPTMRLRTLFVDCFPYDLTKRHAPDRTLPIQDYRTIYNQPWHAPEIMLALG